MPKAIPIYNGTSGLDVRADPVRLKPNEAVIVSLSKCVNCSIDDTGRLSRREGFDDTDRTEAWHSLYSYGNLCLGVLNTGYLCRIAPDFTYKTLAQVDPIKPMGYAHLDGKVYYGNGEQRAYIEAQEAKTWSKDTYDTSILPPTDIEYQAPPLAQLLEAFSGRIFAAYDDQYVGFSERYFTGLWSKIISESKFDAWIRVMKAVSDGLWIGDQQGIHFWRDAGSSSRTLITPANYGAVKGTDIKIEGQKIGLDFLQGVGTVVLFMGQEGVCVGAQGGVFANLTEGRVSFRDANDRRMTFYQGAGLYSKGHYLAMMDRMGLDLNLKTLAFSQTTGWTFNSFCDFQGVELGASSSGIFTLRGSSDDGGTDIDSQFEFTVDMGRACSLVRLYMEGEFKGFMKVTCTASHSPKGPGPAMSKTYILSPNNFAGYQDSLWTDLDSDNGIGRYWTFNVQNLNGADFSIDQLRVEPVYHQFD